MGNCDLRMEGDWCKTGCVVLRSLVEAENPVALVLAFGGAIATNQRVGKSELLSVSKMWQTVSRQRDDESHNMGSGGTGGARGEVQ